MSLGGNQMKPESLIDPEWNSLERKAIPMSTLDKLYEIPFASNKVFLMKKLFTLQMAKGGLVTKQLNEFNTVTSQPTSVGVNLDDEARALLVLCSLPERAGMAWSSVSNPASNSNISIKV